MEAVEIHWDESAVFTCQNTLWMRKYNKIKIIGIGNLLLMDEGIGIHAVNELMKYKLPENIEIFDGGTAGFKLLELMNEADRVIFIDAVDNGKKPGTIISFKGDAIYSSYRKIRYSLHETDLSEVIKMATLLDYLPEIRIIGIQPKTVKYGMELSMELKNAIPEIVKKVFNEIGNCSV